MRVRFFLICATVRAYSYGQFPSLDVSIGSHPSTTCAGTTDGAFITTKEECEAAATELGLSDTTAEVGGTTSNDAP